MRWPSFSLSEIQFPSLDVYAIKPQCFEISFKISGCKICHFILDVSPNFHFNSQKRCLFVHWFLIKNGSTTKQLRNGGRTRLDNLPSFLVGETNLQQSSVVALLLLKISGSKDHADFRPNSRDSIFLVTIIRAIIVVEIARNRVFRFFVIAFHGWNKLFFTVWCYFIMWSDWTRPQRTLEIFTFLFLEDDKSCIFVAFTYRRMINLRWFSPKHQVSFKHLRYSTLSRVHPHIGLSKYQQKLRKVSLYSTLLKQYLDYQTELKIL